MEETYLTPPAAYPYPSTVSWQALLRYYIRLNLAMGSPTIDAQELETHLRRTEAELLAYLLSGQAPTALALARAQVYLDPTHGAAQKPAEAGQ